MLKDSFKEINHAADKEFEIWGIKAVYFLNCLLGIGGFLVGMMVFTQLPIGKIEITILLISLMVGLYFYIKYFRKLSIEGAHMPDKRKAIRKQPACIRTDIFNINDIIPSKINILK